MTREEAIYELKRDIHNAKVTHHLSEHYEMAIKALEQEPCEDCVSRQAVRDTIYAECTVTKLDIDFAKVLILQRAIKALPSVKPIRPKGHWIETAEEYYKAINEKGGGVNDDTPLFWDDIACSECLTRFSVIDNETERFDFCPSCGSDNSEDVEG